MIEGRKVVANRPALNRRDIGTGFPLEGHRNLRIVAAD